MKLFSHLMLSAVALAGAALPGGVCAATIVRPASSNGVSTDPFNAAVIDSIAPIGFGFSAQDVFGAVTPGGYVPETLEGGHIIFSDGVIAPFITFHTTAPVTIGGFDMFVSGDGAGNPFRGFSRVALYASADGGTTFGTLLDAVSLDPSGGALEVSSTFAPVTAQFFRFEGAALNGGARLIEIDGVAAPVPEPATWAMMNIGFGVLGFAMRRRRRAGSFPVGPDQARA